jgi:hypothetical protein
MQISGSYARLLVCMRINAYYDKYLSMSASCRVSDFVEISFPGVQVLSWMQVLLPEAVLGDFVGKLTRDPVSLDIQV